MPFLNNFPLTRRKIVYLPGRIIYWLSHLISGEPLTIESDISQYISISGSTSQYLTLDTGTSQYLSISSTITE